MNRPYGLQRWSSIAKDAHGAELLPAPSSPDALARALATLTIDETRDLAFVLVRVIGDSDAAIQEVIHGANATTIGPRLCLAVSRNALQTTDFNSVNNHRVGLMLDDVDAETPLSLIVSDSIESIRFCSDFVASASKSLRLGCVLESMLLLAHNLGLSTLGPSEAAKDDLMWPSSRFDYTPSLRPSRSLERSLTHAIAVSTSRPHPNFRLSR
jgi:hypothetical protein